MPGSAASSETSRTLWCDFPGPAGIDYYNPVEVVHQTAIGRETAAATGVLRQYRERFQPGLNAVFVNLAFTVDVHGDITVDVVSKKKKP